MKQGTASVLFGCHSFFHSMLVAVAWTQLYRRPPKPWELVCIVVHDWGHWGTQYLDNFDEKKLHWLRGAFVANSLVGMKGYDLVAGHCAYQGQERSRLYEPDKRSWLIAPLWWMWINTFIEPKLIRPGRSRLQSAKDFKLAVYRNCLQGFVREGHDIYLEQRENRRKEEQGQ